jgi:hypothetical protein
MPQPRGSSDYVRQLKNRAIAASYAPRQGISLDASALLSVRTGQKPQVVQPLIGLAYDAEGCCCVPPTNDINLVAGLPIALMDPINGYNYMATVSWEDNGSTSFTLTILYADSETNAHAVSFDTFTSATVMFQSNPGSYTAEIKSFKPCGTSTTTATADCIPVIAGVVTVSDYNSSPPPPYDVSYNAYFDISWTSFPNAISYALSTNYSTPYIFVYTEGETNARLYMQDDDNSLFTITVTGINECSSAATANEQLGPCFLAGSPVTLADGTTKPIEDIRVGDWLLGAFGEHNQVLALHRPVLGSNIMCRINNEHSTTNHHPHIGSNKRIYCNDPSTVRTTTYGRDHPVINGAGETVMMRLHGLAADRIHQLNPGIVLKTVGGARTVTSLETYTMPPETQLYNLVMGGSHTYHVEGYAVTGWPREDDWDYDGWMSKV